VQAAVQADAIFSQSAYAVIRLWQLELAALTHPLRQVSVVSQWHASMQDTIGAQLEITAACWDVQWVCPH
jgi:hypothetical protein